HSEDADAAAGGGSEGSRLADQADASLTVRMQHVGSKDGGAGIPIPAGMRCTKSIPATCTATISCPDADEASDAAEVCRWLNLEGEEFLRTPVANSGICTQQYGGPEVLTIRGTINGSALGAETSKPSADPFRATRQNGCAIA